MSDALTRVLQPDGWALLSSLPPYDPDGVLQLSEGLRRRGLDADLVAAVLTQQRLRAKARAKFGSFADGMVFTEAGIEQATRLAVAALHARRYLRAGLSRVADLTCGLGADTMTMAALGLVPIAVEADAATAAAATVNLRFFPEVQIIHGDCLELDLAELGVEALYADPARRTAAGRRVFDPRAYSPPLDRLLTLAERWPLGLKVAPGIAHADLPEDAEAQWVSVDREVVECGLWFGPLREAELAADGTLPLRSAVVIRGEHATTVLPTGAGRPEVGTLGKFLYEPDGAVIRAHLVAEAVAATSGRLVHPAIAYVTSDRLTPLPYAEAYRVLDSMPFSLKRLKAYLRERGVGRLTIKKRGTAVVPEHLRKQLALRGEAEATIVLTRLGEQQSVIVVERC